MTSASEFFHPRRTRYGFGRHVSSSLELGLDSGPEDRSFHHHAHTATRRSRRDLFGGCDPPRWRSTTALPTPQQQPHRPPYAERDTVRVDEGSVHSSLGNNRRINLSNFGVVGNRRGGHNENDRLPGAVLLARERLLERLRGVSLSANRHSNRVSSRSNHNGLTDGDDYGPIGAIEHFLDTETLRESVSRDLLFADLTSQTDQLSQTQATSKRRPPGLTQNALARLQLEVFTKSHSNDSARASQECSICLENFIEAEELIRLSCDHRFHSVCLDPWVRSCGDCPYCRREIVASL